MKKKLTWAAIVAIVSLSAFMRFYRIEELFYFMHDEETVAFRVLPTLLGGKLFLIGGVTPFHIHLTPYFYYLSALILALGKLDPLAWGVFSGVLGVMTTALIILVGKKIFDTSVGLVGGLLYAGSYLMSLFDRHYWPLSLDPFLAVLVFYGLWQLSRKKFKYFYLMIAVFVIGISADLSTLLFPVVTVMVWFFWHLSPKRKEVTLGLSLFALSFLPVIFFDLRHRLSNVSGISLFFSERNSQLGWSLGRFGSTLLFIPRTLSRLFYIFGNQEAAWQYTYCPLPSIARLETVPWWMVLGLLGAIVLTVWFWKKEKGNKRIGLELIMIFLGAGFAGMNLYGNIFASKLHDHYFATLFPVTFMLAGYLLTRLGKLGLMGKLLAIAAMGGFLTLNVTSLWQAGNQNGYAFKKEAVKFAVAEIGKNDFSLDSLGSCYKYGGWRYLFFLAGKEPTKSYVDQNYFWLYDKPPSREHPDYVVVMISPEVNESLEFTQEYNRYLPGTIKHKRFGQIEVFIVDNHSHQYDGRF